MAKLPVDVTAKEWKKAKPLTLKDPGLDKKLAEWEKTQTELETKTSLAGFGKCADALKEVVTMAKTAQDACNKTLHKDAIAFLGGYTAAVAKVSTGLQKLGEDYSKKVAAWSKKRVDCLAAMKKHESTQDALTKKFEATKKVCEASKGTPLVSKSVTLAGTVLKEVTDLRAAAQGAIDIVRIDDPETRIHVDDRDDKYINMFTEAIKLQAASEHDFIAQIAYLEKFVKENKV